MAVCDKQIVRFGVFELNFVSGELSKHGYKLKLQGQPIEILKLLVQKPGELVTRDEIREHLWPADTFVDFEHSLNTAVKKLRQALGDEADTPTFIETLPRRGYRFVAELETPPKNEPVPNPEAIASPEVTANPEAIANAEAVIEVKFSSPSTLPQPEPRRRLPVQWVMVLAAAIVVVGLAIVAYFVVRGRSASRIESIAVLPLANFSGDPEQEYFADGITEELISDLSQIKALRVISRTSIMRYKANVKSLPEIGRELGVDAVIEGSVQRAGNRVRITAQLVRTDSEIHLWAQTYERDLKDVLSLRDQIARAIAEQIRIEITPQERSLLAESRTVVPEAYDAFLKGKYEADRLSLDGLLKATEYFENSVRLDPNFAKAWAALGHAYFLVGFQSELPPSSRCIPAMKRAMELDSNLAEAHVNYADLKFHRDWKWMEGLAEFHHAVQLNPRSIDARQHYALALWQMARFDRAIEEMQATLALDPLSPGLNFGMAGLYRDAHRNEEALQQYRRTLELEPNSPAIQFGIASFYEERGRTQEALTAYKKAVSLSGEDAERMEASLNGLRTGGIRGYWIKRLDFLRQDATRKHVPPMDFAMVYSHLGDRENALRWLELSYQQHNPRLSWILAQTVWDPLRREPRFQELIKRMNFPAESVAENAALIDHREPE